LFDAQWKNGMVPHIVFNEKEAEVIRQGVFELVQKHGVREYYDPYMGKGLGGQDFSWTAALVIDMLHHSNKKKN
jgi:hypothetical protein